MIAAEQGSLWLSGGIVGRTIEGRRIEVNDHGVIVGGAEKFILPNPRKGWRGCNAAEIAIAPVPNGWAWATSYHFTNEGCSSPLTLADGPFHRHAGTREQALVLAIDSLRDQVTASIRRCGRDRAAAATLAWLDKLPRA